MNNYNMTLLISSSLIIIVSSIIYFLILFKTKIFKGLLPALVPPIIIGVIPLINVGLLYLSIPLQNSKWIFSSITSATLIVFFLLMIYRNNILHKNINKFVMYPIVLFPLIITITGIIIFFLLNSNSTTNNTVEKINLEMLEESTIKVKNKFNEIENLINYESKNIDRIFLDISNELRSKNFALKEMQARERELVSQIAYYKQLSSLTKEQSNSVVKSLNQNYTFNLFISFILGVLSSLFVWVITQLRFVKLLFEGRKNDS